MRSKFRLTGNNNENYVKNRARRNENAAFEAALKRYGGYHHVIGGNRPKPPLGPNPTRANQLRRYGTRANLLKEQITNANNKTNNAVYRMMLAMARSKLRPTGHKLWTTRY